MSDPFNPDIAWKHLQAGDEQDRFRKAKQQENYELTIVKKLVQAAGGTLDVRRARQDRMSDEQTDLLDLAWFARAYAGFPIRLSAGKLPWVHRSMTTLFLDFAKSPMYDALTAFIENEGFDLAHDNVGFVFPVVKHGDMVLHTMRTTEMWFNQEQPKPRDRAAFYFNTDDQDVYYVLETLPRLLKRIGTSWY